MEKSIEAIWQEGFVGDNAIVVPKINDLYNQKSQNLVDKFQSMFDINLKAIVLAAIMILVSFPFFGLPWLGVYVAVALAYVVYAGKKHQQKLGELDKNTDCYHFLRAFTDWLDATIAHYTRIYTVLYPTLFLAAMLNLRFSDAGANILDAVTEAFPDIAMWYGTPVVMVVGVAVITGLLGYFAGPIYRLDMNLVYGHQFKRLHETLDDMEELRA